MFDFLTLMADHRHFLDQKDSVSAKNTQVMN